MWFLLSQGPIHPLQLYSVQVVPQYHHSATRSFHLGLQLCRALPISKLLHASCPLLRKFCPSQPIPKNGFHVNSSEKFAPVSLSQSAYSLILLYTTFFSPCSNRNSWHSILLFVLPTSLLLRILVMQPYR